MVVDAKQGYNLFLMWEETSEFWHKQQPTFVKISWTSKKHYGEKRPEKSNFCQFLAGKFKYFVTLFFSDFVNFWYRNFWKMRLLRIFSTKMFSLLFCCQPPSKILSQKRSSWVNALWPTTCGFTSSSSYATPSLEMNIVVDEVYPTIFSLSTSQWLCH